MIQLRGPAAQTAASNAARWRVALRARPADGAGRGETKVIPLEAIAEPMSAFGGKADMPFCTANVRL